MRKTWYFRISTAADEISGRQIEKHLSLQSGLYVGNLEWDNKRISMFSFSTVGGISKELLTKLDCKIYDKYH